MSREPSDLFDCERVRSLLESYLQEQLPPPERRAMRLHIHACPDCHARTIARDPLQIFAPLADEERPEEYWAGFWPAIRADIHAAESEARTWRRRLLRPALLVPAAAAVILAVSLALLGPWRGAPEPALPQGPPVAAARAGEWHRVLPGVGEGAEPSPPAVEDVRSPSATVLSMKVYGAGEAVTEVVLIVDEEIEL